MDDQPDDDQDGITATIPVNADALKTCLQLADLAAGRCWARIRQAATEQSLDSSHWSRIVRDEMESIAQELVRRMDMVQNLARRAAEANATTRRRLKAYRQEVGCRRCHAKGTTIHVDDLCDACHKAAKIKEAAEG